MGVHRVGAFCVPTVSGWALGWAGERTPCFGLEREAPALRKGFESLGASREDAGCPSSATMKVKVIPVLEDNYMYLVIEERTREAVAVDVAVPKRLLEIVGREGVSLTTVLTTHHHWDHARGNVELARLRPGLAVLGADERICALTRRLVHGEELRFGAIHVRCLLTPGHTSGHMSYFLWEEECPDPPAVFSGDALSVAGCGLRLESTAQQMYESLTETLGSLPPETKRDEDDMPTVPSTLKKSLCASSRGRQPQLRSWRHFARSGRASSGRLSRCSRRLGLSWHCSGGSWAHLDRNEPQVDLLSGQAAHLSFKPRPTEPTGGLPLEPSMALPSWLSSLGGGVPWPWTCEAPVWGACEP
ncbi:hydroxyacylglutathione hydrolase-like protein isoform X3 [Zalophus californianus]|uniref:Hydroxyacylglutathione hydrolase-like protein isoform X3 n=1 Tax=Zalophus californianus TaxID=9704 RepID=A0A6J2EDY0_ZALCA|nr:hydroxyacylglutathione hydrolase-like protein isoform X3 [Zalophus californianus]